MDEEETKAYPFIKETLSEKDWEQIEKAITEHNDPLFGEDIKKCYGALMQSIA